MGQIVEATEQVDVDGDLGTWVQHVEGRLSRRPFRLVSSSKDSAQDDVHESGGHHFVARTRLWSILGVVVVTLTSPSSGEVRIRVDTNVAGTRGLASLSQNPARKLALRTTDRLSSVD